MIAGDWQRSIAPVSKFRWFGNVGIKITCPHAEAKANLNRR